MYHHHIFRALVPFRLVPIIYFAHVCTVNVGLSHQLVACSVYGLYGGVEVVLSVAASFRVVKAWVKCNCDIPINAHPKVMAIYAHVTDPINNSISLCNTS